MPKKRKTKQDLHGAYIQATKRIYALAGGLWKACLVGNPAPVVKSCCDRMANPRPGDFVAELSHLPDAGPPDRAIGVLEKIEQTTRATRYTIRTLAGETVTWTNAMFVALPKVRHDEDFFGDHRGRAEPRPCP